MGPVGRAENRPLLTGVQQSDEAGGVLAERVGGERSDGEDRRFLGSRGDLAPKTGGLVMALRLEGEDKLEIFGENRRSLPMSPDLRQ